MRNEVIRTFLAVELDDALRAQIARVQQDLKERLDRETPGAVRIAWVRPASMHLTLKFLGDIGEHQAGPLREALAVAVRGHRIVRMPFARLGAFPRPQDPRALWVGASEEWEQNDDARRLAGLARVIEDCCEALGLRREDRPFRPHLTLARIKAGERRVGRVLAGLGVLDRPLALPPLTVESVALMKSQLLSDGAVHTRLWEIGLTTSPGS